MRYWLILAGVFMASFGLTVIASKYGPHKNLKHLIGALALVGMVYDLYLIYFVPFQGFQDIVRILAMIVLGVTFVAYGAALAWIKIRARFKRHR